MTDTTEQAPKLVTVKLDEKRQKVRGVQYQGGETITVPERTGKKLEDRELGKITGTAEPDADELEGVAFASPAAEKAARAGGLRAAQFTEIEPAGETGYTAEQVRSLVDG